MRHRRRSTVSSLLALGLVVTAAAGVTGCADSLNASGSTSESSDSADDSNGQYGGKADIYGEDDRREYFQSRSRTLRKVARASAVLVEEGDVSSAGDEAVSLPDETLEEDLPACPTAKFSDQPVPGECSGFLVAPDILVSAGHCIKNQNECDSTRVAFGFRYDESTDENVTRIPNEQVYSCESIISQEWESGEKFDYGVYRLDRPVEGVEPLAFRTDGRIASDARLAVVGHPMGLPVKITAGGRLVDNSHEDWFLYNLDAFGGHSGAAVVDVETGVVEGIHVRGAPDYKTTSHDGRFCYAERSCEEVDPDSQSCYGTEGTRATVFADHVPTATTGSNGIENCCDVCTTGKACGDTCIAESATCREPYGCACNAPGE